MDDLREWLKQKPHDYNSGVRLYNKYGRNPLFIALFQEAETEYKRCKLLSLINQLLNDRIKLPAPVVSTQPVPLTAPVDNLAVPYQGWPDPGNNPTLRALWEEGRPLYAELMHLTHRILEVALQGEQGIQHKKVEAAEMALRIIELDELLLDLYDKRDYFYKHGHLPGRSSEQAIVVDPVVLYRNFQNAQRYLREYKLKVATLPDSKKLGKWNAKIVELRAEIDRLKKLLKLTDDK